MVLQVPQTAAARNNFGPLPNSDPAFCLTIKGNPNKDVRKLYKIHFVPKFVPWGQIKIMKGQIKIPLRPYISRDGDKIFNLSPLTSIIKGVRRYNSKGIVWLYRGQI